MNTVPRKTEFRSAGATRSVGGRRLRIDLRKALYGVLIFSVALGALRCRTSDRSVPMPASAAGYALYTAHCAACHGPNGLGNGPAAIALDVRPRDFRNEPFRYISSLDGVPTEDDLVQTIRAGRHLAGMPAGSQLLDAEIRTLADYVREINRLGWVERLTEEFAEQGEEVDSELIKEIALERVAPGEPITVGYPSRDFTPDTQVGRTLYMDSCASCHGPTGRGDGLDKPVDDSGRPIQVRDLTSGAFRGGTAPREIFKRIRCGVPGTPMPAQVALGDDEVWQLIHYVEFLAGWR